MKDKIRVTQERMEAKIEATWLGFRHSWKKLRPRAECGRGTGTSMDAKKPPKFDRTTSRAMFQHQFETVAQHNCWTCQKESTTWSPCRARSPTCYTIPKGVIWGKPWGPGGPFQRPACNRRKSQSAKNKDTGGSGILTRICHSHRTACPSTTQRHTPEDSTLQVHLHFRLSCSAIPSSYSTKDQTWNNFDTNATLYFMLTSQNWFPEVWAYPLSFNASQQDWRPHYWKEPSYTHLNWKTFL
jgi:hypothetical protein